MYTQNGLSDRFLFIHKNILILSAENGLMTLTTLDLYVYRYTSYTTNSVMAKFFKDKVAYFNRQCDPLYFVVLCILVARNGTRR